MLRIGPGDNPRPSMQSKRSEASSCAFPRPLALDDALSHIAAGSIRSLMPSTAASARGLPRVRTRAGRCHGRIQYRGIDPLLTRWVQQW